MSASPREQWQRGARYLLQPRSKMTCPYLSQASTPMPAVPALMSAVPVPPVPTPTLAIPSPTPAVPVPTAPTPPASTPSALPCGEQWSVCRPYDQLWFLPLPMHVQQCLPAACMGTEWHGGSRHRHVPKARPGPASLALAAQPLWPQKPRATWHPRNMPPLGPGMQPHSATPL